MKFDIVFIVFFSASIVACGDSGAGHKNSDVEQIDHQQDSLRGQQADRKVNQQSPGISANQPPSSSPQTGSGQLQSGKRKEKFQADQQKPLSETVPFTNKEADPGTNPFHRIPQFFVNDFVGGKEPIAYEALKGMEYYSDTRVMVYITDELMVGTQEYNRVEAVMQRIGETENMIFTWVHLGEDNSVKSVKKVYSDNLKNRSTQNSLTL